MRFIAGLCLAALCALTAPAAAGQGTYPQTEEGLQDAYDQLNWSSGSGSYKLPKSHAVIRVRSGQTLLLGWDAERFRWLNNGTEHPDTEAVLSYDSAGAKSVVYYAWQDEGYIGDADWADVNPDQLLEDYRRGTEAANSERIDSGIEPIHVVGWLEKPHYDKSTNTVTYAIELKDKDGGWANAFALRLGRAGYTEFIWVGSIGLFQSAGSRPALLNDALAAHSFEEGHRYADFKEGDKVASYGIAGLVAAAIGAKFGKGLIAGFIAMLIAGKKVVIPLVLAFGATIFKFGRRLLGSES
jgi:uncharacterized membrane-anchored protein